MREISARIKWVRKDKSLTQTEFADKLGVSRSVVNNWERGVVIPPNPTFTAISAIFGVNENWLINGEGDNPYEKSNYVDEIVRRHNLPNSTRIILETLIELPVGYQNALIDFAKALSSKAHQIEHQNTVNAIMDDLQMEQDGQDKQENPAVL